MMWFLLIHFKIMKKKMIFLGTSLIKHMHIILVHLMALKILTSFVTQNGRKTFFKVNYASIAMTRLGMNIFIFLVIMLMFLILGHFLTRWWLCQVLMSSTHTFIPVNKMRHFTTRWWLCKVLILLNQIQNILCKMRHLTSRLWLCPNLILLVMSMK